MMKPRDKSPQPIKVLALVLVIAAAGGCKQVTRYQCPECRAVLEVLA